MMDIYELINRIDPDRGYARWLKVGNALRHAGESFETWDRWSAGSDKYSEAYARQRWEGFGSEPKVSIEELHEMATSEPVRRAPLVRKLWACTNEAELRTVASEIQVDLSIEDGDRVLLTNELRRAWSAILGSSLPHPTAKQLVRAQREMTMAKAHELFSKCCSYPGVTPEVVLTAPFLEAMAEVLGRRITGDEAKHLLLKAGFVRYGPISWRGLKTAAYVVFPRPRSVVRDLELVAIVEDYQRLTGR